MTAEPVNCSGTLLETMSPCCEELTPQTAGRYVNAELVPYLCHNPRCSNYGIPFDFRGQKKRWEDFDEMIQIPRSPHE